MAILNILEFPDPRLRTIAKPVAAVDNRIKQLVDDMFETMYDAPGIGLAASQVNVHERVVVIDLSEDRSAPRVFINPELEPLTDELEEMQEGCLSVPGFYESVNRPERVRVKALDRDGNAFDEVYEGLLVSSTNATTSTASCLSITYPILSATGFARNWKKFTGPRPTPDSDLIIKACFGKPFLYGTT